MGPDTHPPTVDAGTRCPHCRGAVRPQAPWCTQCWADLRPALEPVPAVPQALLGEPSAAPGAVAAAGPGRRSAGWPCAGCGTTNSVELDACVACGTGFLAGLRREEAPLLVLPGVGDLTRLSRAQRLGLAAGVVLMVVLLTALLGLLLS